MPDVLPEKVGDITYALSFRDHVPEAVLEADEEINELNQLAKRLRSNRLKGIWLVKDLLIRTYHERHRVLLAPHDIILTHDHLGKPQYELRLQADLPRYDISISHSATRIAAVVGADSMNIGIDVEELRDFPQGVTSQFLTEAERLWTERNVQTTRARITLIWALKEAYLKALGSGLRVHPKGLEVRYNKDQGYHQLYVGGDGGYKISNARINHTAFIGTSVMCIVSIPDHAEY